MTENGRLKTRKTLNKTLLFFILCLSVTGCGERLGIIRDYRREGISAMQEGYYEEAANAFRHAMDYYGTARKDGTEIDILRYFGEALFRAGEYEEAGKCYERLMKTDARRAEYLDMRSVCTAKSGGDLNEAIAFYREAEERCSERSGKTPEFHLEALYSLGEQLIRSEEPGHREIALRYYQEASEKNTENVELLSRIGEALIAGGDPDSALKYFEKGREVLERRISDSGSSKEEKETLHASRKTVLFQEAICDEYASRYADALTKMEAILAEYGGADETLQHEIAFLKSRVKFLQSEEE